MSYYVKRTSKQNPTGFSYVGPIRSEFQARKEVNAWVSAGEQVLLLASSPGLVSKVRRWEKISKADDAREIVMFQGEQMTMAAYRLNHEG